MACYPVLLRATTVCLVVAAGRYRCPLRRFHQRTGHRYARACHYRCHSTHTWITCYLPPALTPPPATAYNLLFFSTSRGTLLAWRLYSYHFYRPFHRAIYNLIPVSACARASERSTMRTGGFNYRNL